MSETQIPVLNEHQSARDLQSTTPPPNYQPTDEEKKTIQLVNKLFERAKKHRKQYDEKWIDYYKFFRGKQWKEQRPSYRHSEVINMVFQNIQASIPILTDSRPSLQFLPKDPQNTELADILNDVISSDWDTNNWLMKFTELLYDSHIFGTGLVEVGFDPKALYGAGNISFNTSDPNYFFPDPSAWDVNHPRTKYVIYAEPIDVSVLKAEYPDYAEFIKPDVMDLALGNKALLDLVQFKSPVDNRTTLEGTSAYDLDNGNHALKITAHILSDEFVEEEMSEEDPSGGPEKVSYQQKLKYPKGRKICMASGVILEDIENPFDDGKFPFARLPNYMMPREFWGVSEVEQTMSPQKIFNKLVSFSLDVMTLMGNPIWVVDNTSGVDTDNIFNRPGLILEKEPGTDVHREEGVQLQPFVLELVDRMRHWFDDISGSNDVSRGVRPGSVDSGVAIQSLQEAAQTRLRQKSRNIDALLQDVGKLYLSRAFQFYDAPRIIRVSHKPEAQKYFKFHIETMLDQNGNSVLDKSGSPVRVAHITPFVQGEDGQHYLGDPKQIPIQGEFDVKVGTGSSLPFAKTEKVNLAFQLAKLGAIDRTELLKAVDYPNWEAVAARMDQLDQQKQMAAQQAQAQGAPGPRH